MLSLDQVKQRAKAYGLSKLAEETGLTRQTLHNFVSGDDIKLSNFMKLLEVLEVDMALESEVTDEDVSSNLKRWGAPLVASETGKKLTLEKAIVLSLDSLSRDGRLTSVLAYLFAKKAYQVNWSKVLSELNSVRDKQLLGYLLDLSLQYRYRSPLEKARNLLKKNQKSFLWEAVSERDADKSVDAFERYENELAKNWKLKARENPEGAVARMRKWEKGKNEAA